MELHYPDASPLSLRYLFFSRLHILGKTEEVPSALMKVLVIDANVTSYALYRLSIGVEEQWIKDLLQDMEISR